MTKGDSSEVKAKRKAYDKEYRQRPEVKARQKKYKQTEKYKAKQKAYNQRPEQKAKQRARQSTPEYKAYARAHQLRPEQKAKQKARRQIPEVKAKAIARAKVWQRNNTDKYNVGARRRGKSRKYRVMAHYSKIQSNSDIPCCACCGENEFLAFLSIDHITGRKNTDDFTKAGIKLAGVMMYRKLEKLGFPDGYRVLCINCNAAREHQPGKVCPHQRNKR